MINKNKLNMKSYTMVSNYNLRNNLKSCSMVSDYENTLNRELWFTIKIGGKH